MIGLLIAADLAPIVICRATVGDFFPATKRVHGLGLVPKNTPAAVVDLLSKEINLAISHSSIKARLVDLGGSALRVRPSSLFKHGGESRVVVQKKRVEFLIVIGGGGGAANLGTGTDVYGELDPRRGIREQPII